MYVDGEKEKGADGFAFQEEGGKYLIEASSLKQNLSSSSFLLSSSYSILVSKGNLC